MLKPRGVIVGARLILCPSTSKWRRAASRKKTKYLAAALASFSHDSHKNNETIFDSPIHVLPTLYRARKSGTPETDLTPPPGMERSGTGADEHKVSCDLQELSRVLGKLLVEGTINANNIDDYVIAACGGIYDPQKVDERFSTPVSSVLRAKARLPSNAEDGSTPLWSRSISPVMIDLSAQLFAAREPYRWCLPDGMLDSQKFLHFIARRLMESPIFALPTRLNIMKSPGSRQDGKIHMILNYGTSEVMSIIHCENVAKVDRLEEALKRRDLEAIDKALFSMAKCGTDFSIRGSRGNTVLHLAAQQPSTVFTRGKALSYSINPLSYVFDRILHMGGDPKIDTLSSKGMTALSYALENSFYDAALHLVRAGADLDADCRNCHGLTDFLNKQSSNSRANSMEREVFFTEPPLKSTSA